MIAGFAACYGVSDRIFRAFVRPLMEALPEGRHLAMLRVQEGFVTHLKMGLLAGCILATPVILYQGWKFVAPGLYAHETRFVWPFVTAATVFFLAGASFAFWVVFPFGLRFLLGYATEGIQATISMDSYLDFATKLLVLIDGRSVYTPQFGGVYWNIHDVMLEDVDRIEVIRGPGGSLFLSLFLGRFGRMMWTE